MIYRIIYIFMVANAFFYPIESEYIVGGYLDLRAKDFRLSSLESNLLTDLYLAFWGFDEPSYEIKALYVDDEEKVIADVQAFKKENPSCRILLSMGGWGFNDPSDPEKVGTATYTYFSEMVSTKENREKFINSCVKILEQYQFNGIDLDWEYPGDLSRGGKEEDFDNFIALVKEMKKAFKSEWILSCALPAAVPGGIPRKYHLSQDLFYDWIDSVAYYVDRITLMAYDYHTPSGNSKITGVNAPLYRDYEPNSTLYVNFSLEKYLNAGVYKKKIVLGMPLFGRGFQGVVDLTALSDTPGKVFEKPSAPTPYTHSPGLMAFFEIENRVKEKSLRSTYDIITDTQRAFSVDQKLWISYDTPETIALKAGLVVKKQLKGAVFWSVNMDQYQTSPFFPNIKSAKKVFLEDQAKK